MYQRCLLGSDGIVTPLFCVHTQLTEADQDLYRNFPLVVSERWQQEVAETVFEAINQETDKLEQKRKAKPGKIDDLDLGRAAGCYYQII